MLMVLTSNFPRPGNDTVAKFLGSRVKAMTWISARPEPHFFDVSRREFASYGFCEVRAVMLRDWTPDALPSSLALYLSGGDPIRWGAALAASALGAWLRGSLDVGCVIMGASGGAMQLTPNLSLFRLTQYPVSTVLDEYPQHAALGLVPFEVLPHFDRHPPEFIERVRNYSMAIDHDIWCLRDGTAVVVAGDALDALGDPIRLRRGVFV